MNRFLLVLVFILTIIVVWYDSIYGSGFFEAIKFVIYSLLINILTAKLIDDGNGKEINRIIEERNLLQDLLLKKERISSHKLNKSIRNVQSGNSKKRRRKK